MTIHIGYFLVGRGRIHVFILAYSPICERFSPAKVSAYGTTTVAVSELLLSDDRCLDPVEEVDLINVAFEQRHLPQSDPAR